ncbi:type II toxin-antitoxin system Phd/YefM family antitoxin [Nitrospira moscoviensis]|uniref:Antitoxin n=1 Tax=Nitrospira moscoviensis TaxID=42253 RepID=A0A0K2GAH6_NITMO|nr:Toxin-antitoxin system, antitoxin component, PHD family [Nitrospira moscoviensis]
MPKVGVRELKNGLSRYLKRVQGGEEIVVTERGRSVARLIPAEPHNLKRLLAPLIREGALKWSGGKPKGTDKRPALHGAPLSESVIEDRR